MRKGGAAAREMLIQAAANEWKVPAAECSAANSVITHRASGRTTTYGKVAAAAAKIEPPKDVKLKDPKDWKIIGKPIRRLDTYDKLTGKQQYTMDFKLPGMLNAAIKECPVYGGKVKSFNAAAVMNMKGVKKVVQSGDEAVAVVADTWWNAKSALEKLPIEWDEGPNAKVSSATIAAMLKEGLTSDQGVFVGNKQGDATGRDCGCRQEGRGGLLLSVPEPRLHGADERDGGLHARAVRSVELEPERRSRVGRCLGGLRAAGRQVRLLSRCRSAAGSAGARAASMSATRCASPRRCRARRSS